MAKVKREKFIFQSLDTVVNNTIGVESETLSPPITDYNLSNIATPTFIPKHVFVPDNENFTKVTFDCSNELLEQMKNYGYWEGLSQRDIIIEAVQEFFKTKDIKERPDRVKNKKKVGRKPKSITNFIK